MLYVKAAIVGFLASLLDYILTHFSVEIGFAPYNLIPAEAFLVNLGIYLPSVAVILTLAYGPLVSMGMVKFFGRKADTPHTAGVVMGLFAVSMLVFYPLAGWGFLGQGESWKLGPRHPEYLEPGPKPILFSLVLHLVWAGVMGYLDRHWTRRKFWWPQSWRE